MEYNNFILDTKFCQTPLEVINSSSFFEVFKQILYNAKLPDIDPEYYLNILNKILYIENKELSEKERLDFLRLINAERFLNKANKYYELYKYTNNLEENDISLNDIKIKLIKESSIKRVSSILYEKKIKLEKSGKEQLVLTAIYDREEHMMFNSFFDFSKRNEFKKISKRIGDKYIIINAGDKMCCFDKYTLEKKGLSYDRIGGGVEVDDKLYFDIKDNGKSYIYADGFFLGPYKKLGKIIQFGDKVVVNIEISNNKVLMDINTQAVYYIDRNGNLDLKKYDESDNLLKNSYFNCFKIELFDTDRSEILKQPVLKCKFKLKTAFLDKLTKQSITWFENMKNIEIDSSDTIKYNYVNNFSNLVSINRKGEFRVL